jgi:hypothetical protein
MDNIIDLRAFKGLSAPVFEDVTRNYMNMFCSVIKGFINPILYKIYEQIHIRL